MKLGYARVSTQEQNLRRVGTQDPRDFLNAQGLCTPDYSVARLVGFQTVCSPDLDLPFRSRRARPQKPALTVPVKEPTEPWDQTRIRRYYETYLATDEQLQIGDRRASKFGTFVVCEVFESRDSWEASRRAANFITPCPREYRYFYRAEYQ